jgi:hypothetical protein
MMRTAFIVLIVALAAGVAMSQVTIKHITRDFAIDKLDAPDWKQAKDVAVRTYWSGEDAPTSRRFTARLLWSDTALYVRFEAAQDEPLIVSDKPDLTHKVRGLWDRDVCEIFIAPDSKVPTKYFEFEVAPTGEWIDLGIEVTPSARQTDWDYTSHMLTAAHIEKNKVVMAMKVPFAAFGNTPKPGDVWLGNIFRCVGKDPGRGYLAWRPTKTSRPNFHVPSAFGEFRFVK